MITDIDGTTYLYFAPSRKSFSARTSVTHIAPKPKVVWAHSIQIAGQRITSFSPETRARLCAKASRTTRCQRELGAIAQKTRRYTVLAIRIPIGILSGRCYMQ